MTPSAPEPSPTSPPADVLFAERALIDGREVLVVSYPLDLPQADLPELTPALCDVARLLVLGRAPPEIAARRGTSAGTVARQIGQLYRRLGVSSRSELIALLLRRKARAD